MWVCVLFLKELRTSQKILLESTGGTGTSCTSFILELEVWCTGQIRHHKAFMFIQIMFTIIFVFDTKIGSVSSAIKYLPKNGAVKKCEPSFVDLVFKRLNPPTATNKVEVWKSA
ncbi:MAG: hypothetical protein IPG07_13165 [Crocinitomicaceae bacterium]|nr:hypothetical protein [Crocinitomicaceae bacterium]